MVEDAVRRIFAAAAAVQQRFAAQHADALARVIDVTVAALARGRTLFFFGNGGSRLYRVRVAPGAVEPRATVGSGDAFLAGFVAARYAGQPTSECLAFGVACGAESTQHFGAGTLDRREVERLLPSVAISELGAPAEVA